MQIRRNNTWSLNQCSQTRGTPGMFMRPAWSSKLKVSYYYSNTNLIFRDKNSTFIVELKYFVVLEHCVTPTVSAARGLFFLQNVSLTKIWVWNPWPQPFPENCFFWIKGLKHLALGPHVARLMCLCCPCQHWNDFSPIWNIGFRHFSHTI